MQTAAVKDAFESFIAQERERIARFTSEPPRPAFCDYHAGMFADEKQAPHAVMWANEVTCIHEAGHTVAFYVLGLGIGRGGIQICAEYNPGEATIASFGHTSRTTSQVRKVASLTRRRAYAPVLAATAIAIAAGPAAERMYCLERKLPIRTLFSSESDHDGISKIGKSVLDRSPYFRYALETYAWRYAQLLMADSRIWPAVTDLAAWMSEYEPYQEEDTEHEHTSFENFSGASIRAFLKRNHPAVRPGIFAA
ncbi:MAG: hypothetical protein ACR652_01250 [Methylocystis sp.]|uniref:hypothetical protein n=1 Tax=Methylocystis sp. TaxID=1911079 RepID=UPI003DA3A928